VKNEDTQDPAFDSLLRRSMRGRGDTAPLVDCLDADTLAAWADGTLDGSTLARVETHVADCSRCQAMAAVMVRTAPIVEAPLPWWRRSMRSAWLVPVTAGAAAVALWAIVPNRTDTPPAQSTVSVPAEPTAPEAKAKEAPALADRFEARPVAPKEKAATNATRQSADQKVDTLAGAAAPSSAAPPPPSAPPPAAAAAAAAAGARSDTAESARERNAAGTLMKQEFQASREVASPDRAVRWRLGASGSIERTEDGGATWTRLASGVTADLVAGAAPSTTICWVVGRGGTVLRSIDGRTWVSVNVPEPVDLVSAAATSAAAAVVSTADGRRFRTIDGGQNWIREPLQDFPAATF